MAKVQISYQIEKEIEVEFPMYIKYGGYNKIISPSEYIEVECRPNDYGVVKRSGLRNVVSIMLDNGEKISKQEFESVYTEALSRISQSLFMQASEPASDNDIREKVANEIFERNEYLNDLVNEFGNEAKEFEL